MEYVPNNSLAEYIQGFVEALSSSNRKRKIQLQGSNIGNDLNDDFNMRIPKSNDTIERASKTQVMDGITARRIFRQIVDAVNYLHTVAKVAHRDIKIENILLNEHCDVKLSDFGFSHSTDGLSGCSLIKTRCGSPCYASPELIKGQGYDEKTDIWSLGVVLFAMLTSTCPFYDENIQSLFHKIVEKPIIYPSYISNNSNLLSLFEMIFQKDPAQRASAEDILHSAWLNEVNVELLYRNEKNSNSLHKVMNNSISWNCLSDFDHNISNPYSKNLNSPHNPNASNSDSIKCICPNCKENHSNLSCNSKCCERCCQHFCQCGGSKTITFDFRKNNPNQILNTTGIFSCSSSAKAHISKNTEFPMGFINSSASIPLAIRTIAPKTKVPNKIARKTVILSPIPNSSEGIKPRALNTSMSHAMLAMNLPKEKRRKSIYT
ncbi:hypothetical protein TRFO_26022 [Tritrichomonas foetus]|uniref:Protein kinase domain-containing protein n=1 Tax=Tritrichomonas foetus TaxID=1144522 RepID=A0A1J4K542_9EUKA|nr:hypothetical protein TRFO_26022 [Tritrichomonas foetus]|eukprot:OHT06098.1 hypothetical protein TRFO_26022 [Tritrichomonas foetus]